MAEIWLRLLVVAVGVSIAVVIVLLQRLRTRPSIRRVDSVDLAAGLHFFSSASCPTCHQARSRLADSLGETGYVEHSWEERPAIFSELQVDSVPAFLVVDRSGRGTLYPGRVDDALSALGRI
jgi:hypothetical protein